MTAFSVFFDLTIRKIPNWIIAFGLLSGLLLNAAQGFSQFSHSLLGFIGGIGVFIVPFALGWMGAGDVKYFGVVGALLGVRWLPRVLFYSILAGGILAAGFVAIGWSNFRFLGFVKDAWIDCKLAICSFGRLLPASIGKKTANGADSVPWGVAIGAGTIVAYYFDPTGRWAGF